MVTDSYTIKEGEIWLPIKGFENNYEVSNFGSVRSLDRHSNHWRGGLKRMPGVPIKPIYRARYLTVNLISNGGVRKIASIHRLVCDAFLNNSENYPVVNHKDCNPMNNRLSNLEWCSHSYNTKHAVDNGRLDFIKRRKRNDKGQYINGTTQDH